MIPFKTDFIYRVLTKSIKSICEEFGFTVIRTYDEERQFEKTLWDNLVVNMLSAKYAISIYVNDKIFDRISEEIQLFISPNVALEFGWFVSRGQEILLLKDKNSILPLDLQGFMQEDFDINNPETVEKPLKKWLKKL